MNAKDVPDGPEVARCRRVRERLDRRYKTLEEALARMGEISAARRNAERQKRMKSSPRNAVLKRKKSA
jgi:hypothetical protein